MPRRRRGGLAIDSAGDGLAPTPPPATDLKLRFGPGGLQQSDVEKLFAAISRSPLGASAPEYAGKVLRAAVEAGWIVEPELVVNSKRDDVATMPPWRVSLFAAQIDRLYRESLVIPKA